MRSDGKAGLQISKKKAEIAAVLGVYILFLVIGVYSGQTTMSVEIIDPPDGLQFHSSPIELVARVTVKGLPASDIKATFMIQFEKTGETDIETLTDTEGVARLFFPAPSGNYTWQVMAVKEGYPTIRSRSSGFSIKTSLLVYGLTPSASILAVSPVSFKARVTDMNNHLVSSANVTFYLDSKMIGWSLTGANGIAVLLSTVNPGSHTWLASAQKGGEGGVSDLTPFIVGQASSLATGDSSLFRSNSVNPQGNNPQMAFAKEGLPLLPLRTGRSGRTLYLVGEAE